MKRALCWIGLMGCADVPRVSDTQVVFAPAREPTCRLQLLHAPPFGWQVLGYVSVADRAWQDPSTRENLELVRPRACELGGTAVAVVTSYVHTTADGDQYGSAIDYAVLRPMPAAEPPTSF